MSQFKRSISFPIKFAGLLWFISLYQWYAGVDLSYFGVLPRTQWGLIGILFAPLLHADLLHLFSNTVPLLILGSVLFFFYNTIADKVFFYSYFLTEALVWLFARPVVHIGASGLVYGIAFFLFFIGLFRKDFTSLIISIVAAFFYGGIVYGVMPGQYNVSWESHLSGAFVGTLCAFSFRKSSKNFKKKQV